MSTALRVFAVVALLTAAYAAGYLTHRRRTRDTVQRLGAVVDRLQAALVAIPDTEVVHRRAVAADIKRYRDRETARINAYYLNLRPRRPA
jgi:hypothetical protein